jgi:hypothetical protein
MQNLLDPAILFFVFGVLAGLLRSNLEIPPAISRFLSLYLLMALGLKGGFALAKSGLSAEVATTLGCAVALAVIVPLLGYQIMRRFLSGYDAAAIAATYGSVSAVTFITTLQYLESRGLPYGGHMAAAMALMESPAIILAVLFANRLRPRAAVAQSGVVHVGAGVLALGAAPAPRPDSVPLGKLLHEAFTDGAQLLLLGAMLVGVLTGAQGEAMMAPFSVDLFKGMLAFFLLDMGLTAARQLVQIGRPSPFLLVYAVLGPLLHASLALGLALAFGIEPGNGALLMVLAASASYIAVPAALRYAIPEARPAFYIGLSLGVTFPFNLLVGIPLYVAAAWRLLA